MTHQEEKKLGRTLNPNTLMWEFSDKSGVAIPVEKCKCKELCGYRDWIPSYCVCSCHSGDDVVEETDKFVEEAHQQGFNAAQAHFLLKQFRAPRRKR